MVNKLICKLTKHRVNRHRVWHDKVDYRTSCDRCSAPLIRDYRTGWREFDDDQDMLAERRPHPNSS